MAFALAAAAAAADRPAQTVIPPRPVPPAMVALCAPLTTTVEATRLVAGARRLAIDLEVPADAPPDLGLAAFAEDRDGRWFQQVVASRLAPGAHAFTVDLDPDTALRGEPARSTWSAETAVTELRSGIVLWSAHASRAQVRIRRLTVEPMPVPADPDRPRLTDLDLPGLAADGLIHARTGERWQLGLRPDPWPANPFDPDVFRLDLLVTLPDARVVRIPGFCLQPMAGSDRGDAETVVPAAPAAFAVRFRPWLHGRHRLRLAWTSAGGSERTCDLPDLVADGDSRDDYVRVDPEDRRYFSVGGRWWWPVGLNLNSTYDLRSEEVNATRLTPARGSLVYDAMLDRLAAAGGDAAEVWMSSWNLALEWRAEWPGYQGLGRFAQGNAWRLDHVLDRAWADGIRINLVIRNHGQASPANDREWKDNPWNARLGGPLSEAIEMFDDPRALAGQDKLARYIIARWADHPAVLGWKLWSEVDLTAARGEVVWRWHEQAADTWHQLDSYGHPVTTHWAGDFRRVNPQVADLPGIDYLCIDAYRHAGPGGTWRLLADILADSTQYPGRGLSRYRKPCLATEFGAGSGKSPMSCREVDHRTGAWAALVTGHAGAPMLWWWEWVDQGDRWQPYGAIRRFIAGEDLRGADAVCVPLAAGGPNGALWCHASARHGRLLAYLQDPAWGSMGGDAPPITGAWIEVGSAIAAGELAVEWWDCDDGTVRGRAPIHHPGGPLRLACPDFAGHLACKLIRVGGG